MKRPWMPLHIAPFLVDTAHLGAAGTGAYLLLIMDYWLHDGLPDDDRKLAAIARLPLRAWRQMRPDIQAFFHDGWRHHRVDAEIEKMVATTAARQAAASKAGTISAFNRMNGTSTRRARNVDVASTSRTADVHAGNTTLYKNITTTSSGAARARPEPPETEADPGPPPPRPPAAFAAAAPQGFAEKAAQESELAAVMRAKGWVP